ncbi:MAG TPA: hypothetical protein VG826_08345 [Pirellulales bacterium]|nr:hypothetical protein [Pirellulales bacterium]
MRRLIALLIVALCLATSGCESVQDFFGASDSNAADEQDIYHAKTGRYATSN